MKFLRNSFFTIAIIVFFLALTSALSIILLLINKGILFTNNNIDLLDLMFKTSFTLIGSTLSGLVAFLIYFLQDKRGKNEKAIAENQHLMMIKKEFSHNVSILSKVYEIFKEGSSEDIAEVLIKPNSKVKESLSIYKNMLDTSIFKESRSKISDKEFLANVDHWNKVNIINRNLELLLKEITNKESAVTILEHIKREIAGLLLV
jgi:hypothetical protein